MMRKRWGKEEVKVVKVGWIVRNYGSNGDGFAHWGGFFPQNHTQGVRGFCGGKNPKGRGRG